MLTKKQLKKLDAIAEDFCQHITAEAVQRAENFLRASAATSITPPPVGEYWEGQGGYYAGIIRNPENGQRWHLIAHPEQQRKEEWGNSGEETRAISKVDGYANTAELLNRAKDTKSGLRQHHLPAEYADMAAADGHTDYYLPAQTELQLLHVNLHDMLGNDACWSSTQDSAHGAWYQDFEDGYHYLSYKDYTLAVRAVRRILIL